MLYISQMEKLHYISANASEQAAEETSQRMAKATVGK